MREEIDFTENDFKPLIDSMNLMPIRKKEIVQKEVRSQMANILMHFIECKRGWHYNEIFKELIKPYLDNPLVLDYVLRSDVVRSGNITGITGAKIYTELLDYLKRVDSPEIKAYLNEEFNQNHEIKS